MTGALKQLYRRNPYRSEGVKEKLSSRFPEIGEFNIYAVRL